MHLPIADDEPKSASSGKRVRLFGFLETERFAVKFAGRVLRSDRNGYLCMLDRKDQWLVTSTHIKFISHFRDNRVRHETVDAPTQFEYLFHQRRGHKRIFFGGGQKYRFNL